MRITEITLNNFRAFYGAYTINLDKDGKNLMVYGENGSGKSSLYIALKTFFEASVRAIDMQSMENIFIPSTKKGSTFIELKIKQSKKSSSTTNIKLDVTNNEIIGDNKLLIADANKIKGFFDYKSLLKTHLLENENDKINLFKLLVNTILYEQENRFTQNKLGKEWDWISWEIDQVRQGTNVKNRIKSWIKGFNNGLKHILNELESDMNLFIKAFGYNIDVKLDFKGLEYVARRSIRNQNIDINITFFNTPIPQHQHFLNEARLSALAISMYLATVKSNPSVGVLKTLILDDLLIGLDMSNRLPLLEIIKNHFLEDYQIIMTTYDKIWFELVKNHFGTSKWKYIDIYSKKTIDNEFEIPLIKQNLDFLTKAQYYLDQKDYKASAVYVRSEFERIVHKLCDKHNLLVRYKSKSRELKSDDFWKAIRTQTDISDDLVNNIEICRGTVMNPFSHYDFAKPEFETELVASIKFVTELKEVLITKDKSIENLLKKNKDFENKLIEKDEIIKKLRNSLSK